ncbi:MAG: hypothetical protein U0Y08_14500 [Bacteroidia bacterium]
MGVIEKEINYFSEVSWLLICMVFSLIVIIRKWKFLTGKNRTAAWIVLVYMFTTIVSAQIGMFGWYSTWIYNLMYILFGYLIWRVFEIKEKENKTTERLGKLLVLVISLHIINLIFFQGVIYLATATIILFQLFYTIAAYNYLKYRLENFDEPVLSHILNWFAFAVIIDNVISIPTTAVYSKEMFEILGQEQFTILNSVQSAIFAGWFVIIGIGILWNTTSLSSRFSSSSS